MTEHYGIDLDGLLPSFAVADEARVRHACSYQGDIPPGIALGDLPGHEPTLDAHLPIDSRGSGLDLQAAPDGTPSALTQRLPIAYAWEQLHAMQEDDPAPTWSWPQHNQSTDSIQPGRAIAVAVRDLCRGDGRGEPATGRSRSSKTLVVPDFYQEHQQEHLLRGLRIEAGAARLLWRPVAAALTWLQDRGASLAHEAEHLRSIGRLLHLHLGTDCWEATVLELVQFVDEQRTPWVLPGRRLRAGETATPLRGWPNRWLEECCEAITPRAPNAAGSQAWNMLWASPWARALILSGEARERACAQLPPWIDPDLVESGRQKLAPMLFAMSGARGRSRGSRMARELDLEQLPAQEPGDWLNNLQTELSSTELMGAVVTGPFASLPLEGSRPLGEQLVANLKQLDARTILVEGADPTASGICARGAATFGLRSAKGQPTYLDTLPSVSMIAFVQGEPEWVNLLETDEPWVMGSETWSKSPENTRFSIQPRQTEVIVTVHRGGSPTCREVKAEIESSVPHETPVSLHVSITPGQGAPRVEICPDDRAVFRGQNLTLDWDTATDTGRDPEDELDHVERICPQHEPRLASAQKWRSRNFRYASLTGIRQMVEAYVSGKHEIRLYGNGAKQTLPWLYELLKEVDQAEPRWATAVSSDGVPGGYYRPHIQEDSRLLKEFSLQLDDLIDSQDQGELATKVLATISARPPKLLRRLQRFLSHGYEQHSRPMWWAAGHCLKTPQEIHGLLKIASSSSFGDAFKFCARALMYREDALAATPSDLARGLFAKAVNECRRHLNGARFGLGYREPLALSVYLLRRRKYDPNFVPEGSKEYEDAARIFALAIRLMDANPQNVMGGTIQIRKLTAQVLDYVQRKGKGRLTGLVDA